jgi:CRISPR-associated endoribonuclease Cas6
MPYVLDLPIGSTGESPPPELYRTLHANLLSWIDAADPEVARAIHERPVRKPFTISGLTQDRGGEWHWRVTLLEDEFFDALWTGVQAVGAIDLNGRTWPVRWPDALITRQSYEHLIKNVRPANRLEVEFVSSTTFRQGDLDLPLPEPEPVFRSWLSHWNDFAPARHRMSTDLLEVVHACVAISGHRLHTERHDLGHSQIVGFVGQVTYDIIDARRLDQAPVWQLHALADYAEFCGTGRKTTYGMGQTRRIR